MKLSTSASPHSKKNARGFTLVEVLVSVGIVAILAGGVSSLLVQMAKSQRKLQLTSKLNELRLKFEQTVRNNQAWENTLYGANTNNVNSFACLRTTDGALNPNGLTPNLVAPNYTPCNANISNTSCTNGVCKFVLYDQNGVVLLDPYTDPSSGFQLDGSPCTGFDPVAGNPSCPARWQITWQPTCVTGFNCSNPSSLVTGTFLFNNGGRDVIAMNTRMYNFVVYRNKTNNLLDEVFVVERRNLGVDAGACAANSWNVRQFNRVYRDTGREANDSPIVINSNGNGVIATPGAVQLDEGNYDCQFSAPAIAVGTHMLQLSFSTAVAGAAFNSGVVLAP
jgi:prepilin-type N-terminal cleavage/methylation domain-containing protein